MISFLLDTLLATGAVIALVLVLRKPAARAFGAQFAYALWALPLLRFVMPPIQLPASLAPASETSAAAASIAAVDGAAPILMPAMTAGAVPPQAESDLVSTIPWAGLALSLWLGGALALLAWRWISYRRMRHDLLADARPVGEVGNIRLVETPAVSAPVAFGVIDKVVALPMFFMALEDRTARDLAIAHELAHHHGRDLAANILAQPILALHWFNPLAWLGWRAMRRDQEAACDARVVAAQGRAERVRYAQVIASFAAGPRLALAAPMACPMLGEKSIIHRLRSLTQDEISRRRRLLGRGLLLAGGLSLPLTATVTYAATQPEASKIVKAERTVIVDTGATDADEAALHTRTATRDGRTVVLKTERALSDTEAEERIDRAFDRLARLDELPSMPPVPAVPPVPPVPPVPAVPAGPGSGLGDYSEFERRMEAWSEDLEEWSEKFGERYERQAERTAALALRDAPQVIESCKDNPGTVARHQVAADGRKIIVICHRVASRQALSGLRSARATIAGERQMDPKVRDEVLRNLDQEIARIESKG